MIFEPEISVPDNLTGSERRRVSKLLKIVELPHVRYQILKGSDRILREAGIDSRLVREEDGEALEHRRRSVSLLSIVARS